MAHTKQRILDCGLNLLTRTGFAGITVGLLAQRSGMSKSGLFAHFGSKEDVQLELLEETLRVGAGTFLHPALSHPPGLERLRAIVYGWLGWTENAGLEGGCPVAAGIFEYDDAPDEDPVRQRLLAMEQHWRMLLMTSAREALSAGEFRSDLDLEQFVWELCGIYLNHHVSRRFLRDANANARARTAFEGLVERSLSKKRKRSLRSAAR